MSGNNERAKDAPICRCTPPKHRNFWKLFDSKNNCLGWYLHKNYLATTKLKETVMLAYPTARSLQINYFNLLINVKYVQCSYCASLYANDDVFTNVLQACKYHIEIGDIAL